MENNLTNFKEMMRLGMIENFKEFGFIEPVLFFYKDGEQFIMEIPHDLLKDCESKLVLADVIKSICQEPNVFAVGIIIEANCAKLDEIGDELSEQVLNGKVKISQLKEKQKIIVMMFSTPEDEEMFVYKVNSKKKTVDAMFGEEKLKGIQGIFSNFFLWNKN